MGVSEFDYNLPEELIAQEPMSNRDECRLLVLNRKDKSLKEAFFKDIVEFINKGDLFILNDTRVLPARLFAKRKTGGQLEILLLKDRGQGAWEVLVKPGKKARLGENIYFADGRSSAQILEKTPAGGRLVKFSPVNIRRLMNQYGKMPLPHYIKKELRMPDYYQTVYAKKDGAVAAPTAGLHFTKELLRALYHRGVEIAYITLHCGLATFRPVKTSDIREHRMETEFYQISPDAARIINQAKTCGKKIIAVGTTVARAVETAGHRSQKGIYQVKAEEGETRLYIYPGHRFKIIDMLLTNFHLARSTNLILVSAFAGIEFIRQAYQYAIERKFRFYSFGDAMLVK
ncbi:MAG: S-adenosylmethionine:tRNA ribosyltransferase-isomerase [Omnitrophica WOR_2 bacterium SM23_29]|nr:MAG: S-adenosylmethionine:tRNA ribosyltransferase-isomerase [Omnitrophica WOR_2 bacterium SM23_29]